MLPYGHLEYVFEGWFRKVPQLRDKRYGGFQHIVEHQMARQQAFRGLIVDEVFVRMYL